MTQAYSGDNPGGMLCQRIRIQKLMETENTTKPHWHYAYKGG